MEQRRSSVAGAVSRGGALTRAAENNNDFFFSFLEFFFFMASGAGQKSVPVPGKSSQTVFLFVTAPIGGDVLDVLRCTATLHHRHARRADFRKRQQSDDRPNERPNELPKSGQK